MSRPECICSPTRHPLAHRLECPWSPNPQEPPTPTPPIHGCERGAGKPSYAEPPPSHHKDKTNDHD